jgi:small-conductance mechanosensitive channel
MNPTPWQGAPPPDRAALHLAEAVRQLSLDQVGVFLGMVTLGVLAFFASLWGMGRLRQRYPGGLAEWLFALRWPIGSFFFYTSADRGLDVLHTLPVWFWPIKQGLYRLILIILVVGASIRSADLLVGIVRRRFLSEELATDTEVHKVITRIFRGVVLFVAAVIILDNLGVRVLGLITAAGFLGGAFALASKETLANVLGYFAILADRIFRTGDRIAFEKYDGFVRERGLRSIRLEALSGELLTIPNTQLVNYPVRRLTSNEGLSLLSVEVGLLYDYARPKLEEAIRVVCASLEKKFPGSEPVGRFLEFGESAQKIRFTLRTPYRDGNEFMRDTTAAHLVVREACDQAGFHFAFPTRTVELHQGKPT